MAVASRLFSRHYCDFCGSPVAPYSKYEEKTLAPDDQVLLASFNNRDPDNRVAWCFSKVCQRFRPCVRKTSLDIARMYLERKGVLLRRPSRRR